MLPRSRPTTASKAAAAVSLLLFSLTACQQPKPPTSHPPAKVTYSEKYDREIKEIMDLAKRNQWEEAQTKANALYEKDPKSAIVARVHTWVDQQAQQRREQALEDKIRDIEAKNSAFSPTLESLVTEKKDRGLTARKDVRDAVDRIENTPYIPDSYGKTIHEKGALFDFESTKGRMAKVLEKEVTIHLDNVPLETVLINLSQTAGVNIVADKSLAPLKQMLSVNLDKVKLSEFLRYIARNYELQFQVGDELVWVVDAKDPKKLMEETRFYRLRKGFVLPAEFGAPEATKTTTTANNVATVTEVQKFQKFVNDSAPTLPSLERAITNLFAGSKWMIDYERNLVVARGTPEQLDVLEKIIKEFDRPIQQILIEARFVTISKPAFMQLGVMWQTGRPASTNSAQSVAQDFTGLVNSQNFPTPRSGQPSRWPRHSGGILECIYQHSGRKRSHRHDQRLGAKRGKPDPERPAPDRPQQPPGHHQRRPGSILLRGIRRRFHRAAILYRLDDSFPAGNRRKITAGAELNVLASISGDGKSILLALNPKVNTQRATGDYATLTITPAGHEQRLHHQTPTYRTSGTGHARGGEIRRNCGHGRRARAGPVHLCRVRAGVGGHSRSLARCSAAARRTTRRATC